MSIHHLYITITDYEITGVACVASRMETANLGDHSKNQIVIDGKAIDSNYTVYLKPTAVLFYIMSHGNIFMHKLILTIDAEWFYIQYDASEKFEQIKFYDKIYNGTYVGTDIVNKIEPGFKKIEDINKGYKDAVTAYSMDFKLLKQNHIESCIVACKLHDMRYVVGFENIMCRLMFLKSSGINVYCVREFVQYPFDSDMYVFYDNIECDFRHGDDSYSDILLKILLVLGLEYDGLEKLNYLVVDDGKQKHVYDHMFNIMYPAKILDVIFSNNIFLNFTNSIEYSNIIKNQSQRPYDSKFKANLYIMINTGSKKFADCIVSKYKSQNKIHTYRHIFISPDDN